MDKKLNWINLRNKYRFLRGVTRSELEAWYKEYYNRKDSPDDSTLFAFAKHLEQKGYLSQPTQTINKPYTVCMGFV